MMFRHLATVGCVTLLALLVAGPATAQHASSAELAAAIDQLGSFDFETRTAAARTLRRAAARDAAPALERAARAHPDGYVRFRALVILAGLGETAAGTVMHDLIGDRNDRLRTVVYQWFEHHADPDVLPSLITALARERSEFVRPALTRALAAHGADARARDVLVPLVMRGEDMFRGAVIEALGDYRARYAVAEINAVALLEGPLQDDAVTALGRIGEPASRATLASLQRSAPSELQPTISAALCLLGIDCDRQEEFLLRTLSFASADAKAQPLLRGVAHALGVLAARGRQSALRALIDAGVGAVEPARAPIALSVGLAALRDPEGLCAVLEGRADERRAVELVRDAFDMLSEDFEEERFYAAVRRIYWDAPAGSARRRGADVLIETLEY